MTDLQRLAALVSEAKNIAFFGGAGVSTESGIPDFRSSDGLYNQKFSYPPEVILSHSFFEQNPQEFFRFYREKMLFLSARPNPAHLRLAQLERQGKLSGIITQNIDGLHQAAGSKNVFELHGSVWRNYCVCCGRPYTPQFILDRPGVPRCSCGGIIKPDVVLYEEPLNQRTLSGAVECLQNADLLIIGGTSLAVYPAAGLIDYYRGRAIVLINRATSGREALASLVIHGNIGEVLGQLPS